MKLHIRFRRTKRREERKKREKSCYIKGRRKEKKGENEGKEGKIWQGFFLTVAHMP